MVNAGPEPTYEEKMRVPPPPGWRIWLNTSSVGGMLDELEWPSLEARRDRSSMLLFHKIHGGDVSIEKRQVPDPYS